MTARVVVTGGLGRSGRWIVDRLASEGDEVVCVDLEQPGFEVPERDRIDFRAADLTDRGETFDLLGELDPDAVVHWAALPSPTRHAGGRVFETNTLATYNALVGAGRAGARVVWASSESAYGFPFADERRLPDALPITEAHPLRPEDPYGTAKVAGEEVAKMVARRYGVPVASIRPSWIQYPGEYNCQDVDVADGVGNFWSYVDVRDVAGLVAAALDGHDEGHAAFNCAARENYVGRPTVDLFEEVFGEVPEECELRGDDGVLSLVKAEERLGWTPRHDYVASQGEDVETPSLLDE